MLELLLRGGLEYAFDVVADVVSFYEILNSVRQRATPLSNDISDEASPWSCALFSSCSFVSCSFSSSSSSDSSSEISGGTGLS